MTRLRLSCADLAVGCAIFASAACGGSDEVAEPLFVTLQERELTATGWDANGSGCVQMFFEGGPTLSGFTTSVAGSGAPVAPGSAPMGSPFTVERTVRPEGLRVVVTSAAQPLAIKLFTKEFLETGVTDRFEVVTPAGVRHELAHRGAHACESGVDLFAE